MTPVQSSIKQPSKLSTSNMPSKKNVKRNKNKFILILIDLKLFFFIYSEVWLSLFQFLMCDKTQMGLLPLNYCKHILHINGFLLLSRSELSRQLGKQPAKFCTRLLHYLINSLHRMNGNCWETVSQEDKSEMASAPTGEQDSLLKLSVNSTRNIFQFCNAANQSHIRLFIFCIVFC